MTKLPTAKQVLDRIRWDEGFDEGEFTVGYEERGGAIEEVPLPFFTDTGGAEEEIPMHRIRFVRRGEQIVWDRRSRIDLLASVRKDSP